MTQELDLTWRTELTYKSLAGLKKVPYHTVYTDAGPFQ